MVHLKNDSLGILINNNKKDLTKNRLSSTHRKNNTHFAGPEKCIHLYKPKRDVIIKSRNINQSDNLKSNI